MSRKFTKISQEDFKKKLSEAIQKHPEFESEFGDEVEIIRELESGDFHSLFYFGYILRSLNKKVNKDLGKVVFDLENFDAVGELFGYELGITELDNGLVYLGCYGGGDWECPVFFIIYWDGSTFRGYIPSDGNAWNKKYKTAFGSESESDNYDDEDEDEETPSKGDMVLIINDIKNRITIK